jgi:hypothetical protein
MIRDGVSENIRDRGVHDLMRPCRAQSTLQVKGPLRHISSPECALLRQGHPVQDLDHEDVSSYVAAQSGRYSSIRCRSYTTTRSYSSQIKNVGGREREPWGAHELLAS